MSYTDNAHTAYRCPNHRMIAEIQGKVIKLGKQNVASRIFHAKVDKDKIAAWRNDLVRVLHIFNVRSIDFSGYV